MAKSGEEESGWVFYDESLHLSDFWNALIKSGSPWNPLEEWKSFSVLPQAEKDAYLPDNPFFDYWRIQVPRLLAPNRGKNCLNQTYDEEEIERLLIHPLEAFLADSYDGKEAFFEELSQYDCPPSVCGHTFLRTEPTYSCRDCGYDQTCVLCNTCFSNSIHVNHRYRVNTSSGEGYCDCGDEEAFKEGAICGIHLQHKEKEMTHKEVLDKIPTDLRNRAKELFRQIFQYIFKVTQCQTKDNDFAVGLKEKQTWPALEFVFNYSNNCAVLFNDNSHSYNVVANAIRENLGPGVSHKMASDITAYVDKHGIGILKVGAYGECSTLCSKFDTTFSTLSEGPFLSLKCKVVPACMAAHQTFATRLLLWITEKLIPKCIVFRAILSEVIFSTDRPIILKRPNETKCESICDAILLLDAHVWKDIRTLWKNVISSGVMKDFESKRTLAKVYSKNYSDIMNAFVEDDQEAEQSITTLSIQIFAVPSLVQELLESDNIFYKIVLCFYDLMKIYIDHPTDGQSKFNFHSWQGENMSTSERSQNILADLGYILSLLPSSISEKTRRNFLEGMKVLTECLALIQGIYPLTQQTHSHSEFEDLEFERPYQITAYFTEIMYHVSKWCEQDKGILIGVVDILLDKCFRNEDGDNMIAQSVSLPFQEKSYQVMDYKVGLMPVSFHLPIHRFFSKIIIKYGHFMSPGLLAKVKRRMENKGSLLHLMNPVLNVIVMLSQVNAGMWKRSGSRAEALSFIYTLPRIYRCPKKDDLILIQIAAALSSDSGLVIMSLMQRFRIVPWANGDNIDQKSADFFEKHNALIDEFLSFLLALVSERQIISSSVEPLELEHRIIQLMCIGPMKHSSIITLIGDDKDVDTIIQRVADPKKDGSKTLYHIKPEYLPSYNPFYFFYTREQRSKAMENVSKLRKKLGKTSFCPPPCLPPFPPLFEGLRFVLRSLPIIKMLKVNFERDSKNLNLISKHVHKLLFLVAIGIQDDMREGIPRFVEMVEKINLHNLLKERMNDWDDSKEVFSYVIDLLSQARSDLLGIKDASSSAMDMTTSSSESDKKRTEQLAASRKAKIMAQMNLMQKKFALENAQDLVEMDISNENDMELDDDPEKDVDVRTCVATGLSRGVPRTLDKMFTCILCQEKQKLFSQSTGNSDALIMASFIQKSAVLTGHPEAHQRRPSKCFQDYLPSDLSIGPAVTSCGHTMHAQCYQKFFSILISKERERRHRRVVNFDVSQHEYLCPICERLSNSVLPVVPPISSFIPLLKSSSEAFSPWIKRMKNILSNKLLEEDEDSEKESSFNIYTSLNKVIRSLRLKVSSSEHPTPNMEMPLMPTPLNDMCNAFAMAVFIKSLGSDPHEGDPRVLQMLFQSLAFSLHLVDARSEVNLNASEREIETLRSLVRLCVTFPMTTSSPSSNKRPMHRYLRSNVILLFSFVFEPYDDSHVNNKSFLDIDALEMLLLLIVGYSSFIFGEDDNQYHLGAHDQNILTLIYLVHLSQLAVSLASAPSESFEETGEDADDHVAQQFIERFANGRKLPIKTSGVAQHLKRKSLRFLRCAALFFHLYTDIPRGGSSQTYDDLTRYLGLPGTLSELLHHSDRQEVVENLVKAASKNKNILVSYPCIPRSLIKLPKNYSTLLNDVTHYKCPSSTNGEWKLPVLCLICGSIVCQFSHCCATVQDGRTVGGCTSHARKCSADVGIFLNIGECLITLIVDGERGAFLSAPYVDEYGEYDDELRRGAPLFLDEEKYLEFNNMWLHNSTSDKICRSYEEVFTINSDWHTL